MGRDNILLTYVGIDMLFVATGALLIIFALETQAESAKEFTKDTVVRDLLLGMCPLNAAIANAVLVFITFLISIPAIVIPSTRGWLKLHGYLTVICALFTLNIGLSIWFETLRTRKNLSVIWISQPPQTQSLLQQTLQCCGYANSTSPPFVQDSFCTSATKAASELGCVTPFSKEANNFLDLVFTGAFGIVGIDAVLVITTAILLKDRKEKERYRFIDEKNGAGAF
ncbi:hypothetical protein HYFRA_00008093 [Hymenoscyphus fraxineus]|uniref:Tetraspanin n=1 Tax=Hymenoscyphus fraxineus TaxID=746836 RepID=A0A9N9KRE4_9HELO|nr:hypothetical protein HYFRA_00008093 [Hymenoscyphus fraxineus]